MRWKVFPMCTLKLGRMEESFPGEFAVLTLTEGSSDARKWWKLFREANLFSNPQIEFQLSRLYTGCKLFTTLSFTWTLFVWGFVDIIFLACTINVMTFCLLANVFIVPICIIVEALSMFSAQGCVPDIRLGKCQKILSLEQYFPIHSQGRREGIQ